MAIQRYEDTKVGLVRKGVERRIGYTDHLLMAILDFEDGPQDAPDPPHSHPHEQISYVAAGEIYFIMEDTHERLGPGDMFLVPPNEPHTIQLLTNYVRLVDCFHPVREDFISINGNE